SYLIWALELRPPSFIYMVLSLLS
ncbi:hypothetical protein D047_4721B, partial [Vibrio parahaemolyticus VPTS-2010_2]